MIGLGWDDTVHECPDIPLQLCWRVIMLVIVRTV